MILSNRRAGAILSAVLTVSSLGAVLTGPKASAQSYMPNLLPKNSAAGQCYARVKHAPKFSNGVKTVTVQDGHESLEVDPEHFVQNRQSIEVKEASIRYEVRQPSFKRVKEYVMTRPAYEKMSVTPPQFETITQTLETRAPRRFWKKGNPGALAAQGYAVLSTANGGYQDSRAENLAGARPSYSSAAVSGRAGSGSAVPGNIGSGNAAQGGFSVANPSNRCGPTCEIWCLVEAPAITVSYNRNIMTAPAQILRTPIAAKFSHYYKQVVDDPGGVKEIPIPAQRRDIYVQDVVPAAARPISVAPKTAQIETQTLRAEERYEWVRVICNSGQVIGSVGRPNYPEAAPGSYTPAPRSDAQPIRREAWDYSTGYAPYSGSHTGIVYGGQTAPSQYEGSGISAYQGGGRP